MREIYKKVKITNYLDIEKAASGIVKSEEIRTVEVEAYIDTGTIHIVIPRDIFQFLGLREIEKVPVKYADGRETIRPLASVVEVEINKRKARVTPIVEEESEILIGNSVIEDMDFLIDSQSGELLPRHPEVPGPLYKIRGIKEES